ncbi:MAG: hypothetical protein NVSMB46_02230 [Candidatus Saccharimonadales bacterium]
MPQYSDTSLITELLEVQRTLGWMDIVIGNITDAVYVTDKNSVLVFVNQSFSDLVNVPRVFLLGQKLNDVFPTVLKKDHEQDFISSQEYANNDIPNNTHIYQWHIKNTQHIFKISHREIPTIQQTVYIAKDITTEYELSMMKSNFIDIASHQLRTPMTAIMTYAHMLHDGYGGQLDGLQKELAQTIVVSSERMIRLINDILLITRVQNDNASLRNSDTTLNEIMTMLDSEFSSKFLKKHIKFTNKYSDDIHTISCNKFTVHEILSNLLSNAYQYTMDGGRISLATSATKQLVTVTITDSGIGIPKEYIPKIFNQFSRAQNAFKLFNEGTGLGLYIVKILLTQLNGNITCTSTINKGTTFVLSFPY